MDEDREEVVRRRLTLFTNKMQELSTTAGIFCKETLEKQNVQDAQICASKLDAVIKRFSSELNEYFKMVNQPSADDVSSMTEVQINAEEVLIELKYKLKEKDNTSYLQEKTFSAKLPTLTLPEFSGDILKWTEYWDIFRSNIHERPIADVDKLLYLKSTLKDEPRKIIDGLETTNSNYKIAINILQERYGKATQIIDAHYSALRNIKTGKNINESRLVLNEIERHLRVLHSLGADVNHNHLRHLITEKFPEDIIYEMKMKMKEETVEEMRKHLETIITAREEANRLKEEKSGTEKENNVVETLHTTDNRHRQLPQQQFRGHTQGRNYNNRSTERNNMRKQNTKGEESKKGNKYKERSQSPCSLRNRQNTRKHSHDQSEEKNKERKEGFKEMKRRKLSCIFCEKDHFSDQCKEYKNIQERKAKLKNRCFVCLFEGHRAGDCKRKRECAYCQSKFHHRSLCPTKFNIKNESTTMTTLSNVTEFKH